MERGHEVVLTDDGCVNALYGAQSSSGVGVPVSREMGVRIYERAFGFDTMEVGQVDYSYKPVKPIIAMEQQTMESVLHSTIVPIFYGAMPNLALYARPDGPFGNPADLLPAGKIAEAREAQEQAAQVLKRDMLYVARKMAEVGTDGINFDTTASAGDAEFLATLETVEELAATTDLAIEVGMAAEFVLGMHGQIEYKGRRLAGLYPHDQVKLVRGGGSARLRAGGQHQHPPVGLVEHRPGGHPLQGLRGGRHHPRPPQRGYRRGRGAHGGVPAHRHRQPGQRRHGGDRPLRRVIGRHRGSLRDARGPCARLRDGRHPHSRRSGCPDAARPQDATPRGKGVCG